MSQRRTLRVCQGPVTLTARQSDNAGQLANRRPGHEGEAVPAHPNGWPKDAIPAGAVYNPEAYYVRITSAYLGRFSADDAERVAKEVAAAIAAIVTRYAEVPAYVVPEPAP